MQKISIETLESDDKIEKFGLSEKIDFIEFKNGLKVHRYKHYHSNLGLDGSQIKSLSSVEFLVNFSLVSSWEYKKGKIKITF